MTGGIIVYEYFGHFYPLIMADDTIYDSMKRYIDKHNTNFINGKKGITNDEINDTSNKVCELVRKVNEGEQPELKKELEAIF